MAQRRKSNDTQSDDESTSEEDRQRCEEEKTNLIKEIDDLERYISNAELTLGSLKYGDIEIKNKNELINIDGRLQSSQSSRSSHSSVLNIDQNINIEYELYKMTGLYCTKVTDNEFVFSMSALSNDEAPAAVQFFADDEKITLGNWVMPLGITIDHILAETPLERPIHVIPFVRNCKKHVLCYNERKEQFDKLKETLSTISNSNINSNYGYLTILIDLVRVKIKSTNNIADFTVHLFYNSGKVRPHMVKVDCNLQNKSSEKMIINFRNYTKRFKKDTLEEAYKRIAENDHPIFEWMPEVYGANEIDALAHDFGSIHTSQEEDDSKNERRKRKRSTRGQREKGRKMAKKDNISPEKFSEDNDSNSEDKNDNDRTSELLQNESVTKKPAKKRAVARNAPKTTVRTRAQDKKKNVPKNQSLLDMNITKNVLKTKNTNAQDNERNKDNDNFESKDKNKESTESAVEKAPNERQTRAQNVKAQDNKAPLNKSKGAKVQEKNTVKSVQSTETKALKVPSKSPVSTRVSTNTPNTRAKQTELNFKGTPVIAITRLKEDSNSGEKKTFTSTPMTTHTRKTKQFALNLSPIKPDDQEK